MAKAKARELERRRLTDKEREEMIRYHNKHSDEGLSGVITHMAEKFGVHVSNGNAWIICSAAGQKWRKQGGKSEKKLLSEKTDKKDGKKKSEKVSSNKKTSALAALKGKKKK